MYTAEGSISCVNVCSFSSSSTGSADDVSEAEGVVINEVLKLLPFVLLIDSEFDPFDPLLLLDD